MKKVLILFICLFANITVNAEELSVKFSKCVDGDTAKFIYKEEEITARFLAIDTPESVHPTIGEEPYGKDASNYTCNELKAAEEIILEFDDNSDKTDKYGRYLVWVFVDGELLQKKIIKKGYAEVAYLYGDYKYTSDLEKNEAIAKKNNVGIWSVDETKTKETVTEDENKTKIATNIYFQEYNKTLIILALLVIVILCILSKNIRKKILRILKREIKKELKK